MSRWIWALIALAVLAAGAPIAAAVVVTTVLNPAAGQVRTIACPSPLPASGDWRPPYTQAYRLTSRFGTRTHPVHGGQRLHAGVDLVAGTPPATVVAAAPGTVTHTGYTTGGGNTVTIDHGAGITTRYLHLARPAPVVVGQEVQAGEPIGTEGATGTATGTHLHFEVRRGGQPVDPEAFMLQVGAPLTGAAIAPTQHVAPAGLSAEGEGGIGFALPEPGQPRKASLVNPAQPIPDRIQVLYRQAGDEYNLPWTLLAGIGMAETNHGATTVTSSAGARGLMQFMPATWTQMGVDGDGDGTADITSDADSIHSAARYLVRSGAHDGPDGVRRALRAYNHADWYVNDVLAYAGDYGGGTVLADPTDCGPGGGTGTPDLPPIDSARVRTMLAFAAEQAGDAYVLGANGPDAWDCSSLTQAALARVGITAPRTAQAQRDWLALGNGYRVPPSQARPGDLVFYDSYLGADTVGHVAFVWDPASRTTIEAANPAKGVGHYSYADQQDNAIFEIWRIGAIHDQPPG